MAKMTYFGLDASCQKSMLISLRSGTLKIQIHFLLLQAEKDYDELDRNFFLIGGANDPLSFRYEVAIRDADGIEHKSAERYYWYKMAELFKDTVFILHFNTSIFTLAYYENCLL